MLWNVQKNQVISYYHVHPSARTLKTLTGDVSNTDYLGTEAPVKGWGLLGNT